MTEKLSREDGRLLLKIARENILREFGKENENLAALKKKVSALVLEESRGTFVSLHKKGGLRGCIGTIDPVTTVFNGVIENAKHAAFNDSRFNPLSPEELTETKIEISILTRPEPLDYKDAQDLMSKLRPGIDGVTIQKQYHRATFLPQVWQQLKDPHAFLTHLCMKAGLSSDEWKSCDLSVSTYQAQVFEE